MKNRLVLMVVAASALSFPGAPAVALPLQGVALRVADLDDNIRHISSDLDLAQARLARTREQYKAGQVSQNDVEEALSKVEMITRQLELAKRERKAAGMQAALVKRVDLRLDHATLAFVAKVLAKVSGVSIKVDADVPADASTVLNMDVQAVPLASVLEAIATKA